MTKTVTIRGGDCYQNVTLSLKCSTVERARKAGFPKSLSKMMEAAIEEELSKNGV